MGSKIMAGSPGVLALLDGDRYPFADKPPVAVRSTLYHWDFTRIDTPWAAAPSEALLPSRLDNSAHFTSSRQVVEMHACMCAYVYVPITS